MSIDMISSYLQSDVMRNSSIEEQLLLCCARTYINDKIVNNIRLIITNQDVDWKELINLADCHHLLPLLCVNLQKSSSDILPDNISKKISNLIFENIAKSMSLTANLLKILSWFATENINVISYKGSVFSSSIYGDIWLRQYYDIDLFVHKQDFAKSIELLNSKEYFLKKEELPSRWENTFVNADTSIEIDLHQGLAHPFYPFRLDFESCMQHHQNVDLLGEMVKSFSIEDSLLVLSVQIVKDSYIQECILSKVCDIAELVNKYPKLQWDVVIDRAASIGCQRLLLIALLSAHNLLGTTLPESIWKMIKDDWVICQYGELFASNFFHQENSGNLFLFFKLLALVEYPLHSPHNIYLFKGLLSYPINKLFDYGNQSWSFLKINR